MKYCIIKLATIYNSSYKIINFKNCWREMITHQAQEPRTPSPDCTDLNQGVPVNLTCKLTRKQQTVKFKSVSAGFPNHSYMEYRQGLADTENDKDRVWWACNKSDLLRIGNELPMPISNWTARSKADTCRVTMYKPTNVWIWTKLSLWFNLVGFTRFIMINKEFTAD